MMNKRRAFEPVEQEIGEPVYETQSRTIYSPGDPWPPAGRFKDVSPEETLKRDKDMAKLMDSDLRIGTIVVEAHKHLGQQLWPLNWGAIIRYERNYELNGRWRPVVCRFFDSLMERHFHPKELLVVYNHIPFNVHSAAMEERRKALKDDNLV